MKTNTTLAPQRPIRLLRLPKLLQRVPLCRSSIYALMDQGKFPLPIKISENAVAWLEHEIDDYLQERIAERDATV